MNEMLDQSRSTLLLYNSNCDHCMSLIMQHTSHNIATRVTANARVDYRDNALNMQIHECSVE